MRRKKTIEEALEDLKPVLVHMQAYWSAKNAVPRVACPSCQFEYIPKEDHICNDVE